MYISPNESLIFKGTIEVEPFEMNGIQGSFVVMARTQVRELTLVFGTDADMGGPYREIRFRGGSCGKRLSPPSS